MEIKCPKCGKISKTKAESEQHMKEHQRNHMNIVGGKLPVNPDPVIERSLE